MSRFLIHIIVFLINGALYAEMLDINVTNKVEAITPEIRSLVVTNLQGYSLTSQRDALLVAGGARQKRGFSQTWSVLSNQNFIILKYFVFDSHEDALAGALHHISNVQAVFKEGSLNTPHIIGSRSWVSSGAESASMILVKGRVVLQITGQKIKRDDQNTVELIARTVLEKNKDNPLLENVHSE